jgi:hypothetical protein
MLMKKDRRGDHGEDKEHDEKRLFHKDASRRILGQEIFTLPPEGAPENLCGPVKQAASDLPGNAPRDSWELASTKHNKA